MTKTIQTPFDLTKALAGARVVNKRGQEVTQIHLFTGLDSVYQVHGVVTNSVESYTVDGKYFVPHDSPEDLVMEEMTRTETVWLNVYPKNNNPLEFDCFGYKSQQEADGAAGFARLACVDVELPA